MHISLQTVGDVTVVKISGKMSLGEGDEMLKDTINSLISQGRHRKLVLDLEDVPYIDSAGNGELVRTFTTVSRQGGVMILCYPSIRLFDLLSITKLRSVFDIVPSISDGVAFFNSREHLGTAFEVSCPVCHPGGKVRFVLGEFFDDKECVFCGVSFRMIPSAEALVDVATDTTARLYSMRLGTYQGEWIRVTMSTPCAIGVPRRLDLFSVEVLEKAWSLIPKPRRIVLDVSNVEEYTEKGLARLLDLSDDTRGADRSVFITEYPFDLARVSAIKGTLVETGRAARQTRPDDQWSVARSIWLTVTRQSR